MRTKNRHMKKSLLFLSLLVFSSIFLNNCTKTITNPTGDWDITAVVNSGGQFDVTATANINVKGTTFTATITTIDIGGAAEVHVINLTGDVDGDKLIVDAFVFPVVVGGNTNTVTLSVTLTITDDALTGTGTYSEIIPGVADPVDGTVTITGTKK